MMMLVMMTMVLVTMVMVYCHIQNLHLGLLTGYAHLSNTNSDLGKQLHGVTVPIVLSVDHTTHVSQIYKPLGTHRTGQMSDKDHLFRNAGTIAIDHSIFFAVQTTTISHLISITAIVKSTSVTVVPHCQNFTKVGARNHGADL
jgi:hypothetical protein